MASRCPRAATRRSREIWLLKAAQDDETVYAGGDPGVLFESHDGGASWELNRGLWEQPTRGSWQAGGGGLCLHSIAPWPGDPDRLAIAISAAGVWLSDDRGETWRRGNKGIVPGYMPEEVREEYRRPVRPPPRARAAATRAAVHAVPRRRLPLRRRRASRWIDIAARPLPGDFAFPLAVDPADPD
jgi:hypothetical protein